MTNKDLNGSVTIEGVTFEIYTNDDGQGMVRVFDQDMVDNGESIGNATITLIKFPSYKTAFKKYDELIAAA